jgi:hypothetical protein
LNKKVIIKSQRQFMYGSNFNGSDVIILISGIFHEIIGVFLGRIQILQVI